MTSTGRSHSTDQNDGPWTMGSLLALVVFFVGCGCFTMAEIYLGSNDAASAVLAIAGTPLFIVGGIILILRSRIGEAPKAPRPGR